METVAQNEFPDEEIATTSTGVNVPHCCDKDKLVLLETSGEPSSRNRLHEKKIFPMHMMII